MIGLGGVRDVGVCFSFTFDQLERFPRDDHIRCGWSSSPSLAVAAMANGFDIRLIDISLVPNGTTHAASSENHGDDEDLGGIDWLISRVSIVKLVSSVRSVKGKLHQALYMFSSEARAVIIAGYFQSGCESDSRTEACSRWLISDIMTVPPQERIRIAKLPVGFYPSYNDENVMVFPNCHDEVLLILFTSLESFIER